MYKPKYFGLEELVWESIYKELHDKGMLWVLWRRFDDRFLITIDQFREDFGSTLINNWSFVDRSWLPNQKFEFSGARPYVIPKGQKWSLYTTHAFWDTADLKVKKYASYSRADKIIAYNEARRYILSNPDKYKYVTVLESGEYAPTWVHTSTCNFRLQNGNVRVVKPK